MSHFDRDDITQFYDKHKAEFFSLLKELEAFGDMSLELDLYTSGSVMLSIRDYNTKGKMYVTRIHQGKKDIGYEEYEHDREE